MKRIIIVIIFISCFYIRADYQNSHTEIYDFIEYTVSIDQFEYTNQDTLLIELKVKNYGTETKTFVFPTSKLYDFEIRKDNDLIWVWSWSHIFCQVITYVNIGVGDSLTFFEEEYLGSNSNISEEGVCALGGWLACYDNDLILYVNFDLEIISSSNPDQLNNDILLSNYPNPFNSEVNISFSSTENTENTELSIYNVKGQRLRKFEIEDAKCKI